MGDTLELITNEVEVTSGFYKVSSGALSFEVKGYGPAFVGFAKTPSLDVYYWVAIDNNRRSIIEVSDPRRFDRSRTDWVISSNSNFTMNTETYKKYWILWDCKLIQVGDGTDVCKPTITKPIIHDLNYVVFMSDGSCEWKIQMPPASLIQMLKPMPPKSIEDGMPQWLGTGGQLPEESIIGGYENGETLYIIRGPYRGSLTPGKFVPSEGVSYISWGGESHVMDDFEVLCGYNIEWVPTHSCHIPTNAFIGGHTENGEVLYIGRVRHNGNLVVGKAEPGHKVCYIPYEDKEVAFEEYEILTVPDKISYVLCGYNIEWVPTHSWHIPTNAFIAGHTEHGEMLYIGRVHHNGNLILGKVQPAIRACSFPYKDKEISLDKFEILTVPYQTSYVLCGYDIEWVPTHSNNIPTNALIGGYSEVLEALYIGRVRHNGNVIVGKVQPGHKVCYFPYEDKEVASEEYEILTVPHQRSYISHDMYISNLKSRLVS